MTKASPIVLLVAIRYTISKFNRYFVLQTPVDSVSRELQRVESHTSLFIKTSTIYCKELQTMLLSVCRSVRLEMVIIKTYNILSIYYRTVLE